MRRVHYALISAAVLALVVGTIVAWRMLFPPSQVTAFYERLRLPQYMPEDVEWRMQGSDAGMDAEVRAGLIPPYLILQWETVRAYDLSDYLRTGKIVYDAPHIGMAVCLIDIELEVDLGGQRNPVTVDGVQGWFTRLGPDDFTPLNQATVEEGTSGFGLGIYGLISAKRRQGGIKGIEGEAIALQWNKEGIHYLLIAQDIEPMNEKELLKIANSMASSELPIPSSTRQ